MNKVTTEKYITNSGIDSQGRIVLRVAPEHESAIVTAVNACKEINPDNPQVVAENIGEMEDALRDIGMLYSAYSRTNPDVKTEEWENVQKIMRKVNQVLAKLEVK
jgi:hypothetical protein